MKKKPCMSAEAAVFLQLEALIGEIQEYQKKRGTDGPGEDRRQVRLCELCKVLSHTTLTEMKVKVTQLLAEQKLAHDLPVTAKRLLMATHAQVVANHAEPDNAQLPVAV